MAFSLFPKKKVAVKSKSQELEEQKQGLVKEILLGYLKKGYSVEKIKKIFIKKGYPAEFVDYLLEKEKEVKDMAKKEREIDDEELLEEEEEEEDEDEDEEPTPPKKILPVVKSKPKVVSQPKVDEDAEWKAAVEQSIQALNGRIAGIESALFRAGVLR